MQDAISHDPYEDQLSAARFKAERDIARQEIDRMRPAFEWVEEHGGLEKIKRQRIDSYPRDAYERKRGKLLKHIAECEKALGKRKKRVEELEAEAKGMRERIEAMLPRLMPEGYMWPEFENGDPVRIGDEFVDGGGNTRRCTSIEILHGEEGVFDALIHWSVFDPFAYLLVNMWLGGRVKRPALKVLDADRVEIREGDTVWHVETGEQCKVVEVDSRSVSVDFRVDGDGTKHTGSILPANLTHRAPVLASDGRPLRGGDTVWEVETGDVYVVERIYSGTTEPDFPGHTVACRRPDDIVTHVFKPSQLTHERPVLDADGVPIKKGEHVFGPNGGQYRVTSAHDGKVFARHVDGPSGAEVESAGGEGLYRLRADRLTHTKPEIDSWQRIEEDALFFVEDNAFIPHDQDQMERDMLTILRRCKALAERERGE